MDFTEFFIPSSSLTILYLFNFFQSLFPVYFFISFRSKAIIASAVLYLQKDIKGRFNIPMSFSALLSFQAQKSFAHIVKVKTWVYFLQFSICAVELPGSFKWDQDIKMSFPFYLCVYIYICNFYLGTVVVLKSSWSVEKTKKRVLLFLSCSKWETDPKNSYTRSWARNRAPVLLNPILNSTFTSSLSDF